MAKINSTVLLIVGLLGVTFFIYYLMPIFTGPNNTTIYSNTINDNRPNRPNRSSYNYMYSHGNSPREPSNWFGPGGQQRQPGRHQNHSGHHRR
jgi:hypothetical protein